MNRASSILSLLVLCVGCAHGQGARAPTSPVTEEASELAAESENATEVGATEAGARFEAAVDAAGRVPPEAVQAWVTQPAGIRVLDVRDAAELSGELGHIRGAENVPLAELEHVSATWDKASPVVVVCKSGKRSAAAAEQLKAQGFTHVGFMEGGMLRWNEEGRPVERGEPKDDAAP